MSACFRLADVFSDHMVLCRNKPIRVFGKARSGRKINAQLGGQSVCSFAYASNFELGFAPMEAGGPYTLTVSDGETTVSFVDVWIGEVYIAGGQSNMEMELQNTQDGKHLSAQADYPQVRFYTVPRNFGFNTPDAAAWRVVEPGTCGNVSAAAFHFAVRLQAHLGVAVGVIGCYWGATSVSCWMSEEALRRIPSGRFYLDDYAQRMGEKSDAQYDAENELFERSLNEWNAAADELRALNPAITQTQIDAKIGPCPWFPPIGRMSPYRPFGLFETMLKPLAPYTLSGMLYYQGETDAQYSQHYEELLTSMVLEWRYLFRDESLPFLNVQLPMYIARDQEDDRSWPEIRKAQENVSDKLANTGLAVMIDCGEWDNIHPLDKKTVGERLYLQALSTVYGEQVSSAGPRAVAMLQKEDELTVVFNLPIRGSEQAYALFEIAGEDGIFVPATAQINADRATLSAASIRSPLYARYAWVNYGLVNVFGENGLPLAPFMMD